MALDMKCEDCGSELTVENQAEGDEYSVLCQECWDALYTEWEPVCSVCGTKMVQSSDRWTIYCPISDIHPKLILRPA